MVAIEFQITVRSIRKKKRIKNKVEGLDTGFSEMEEFGIR